MELPHFVWVTETRAINLDLVTSIAVREGAVLLWDTGQASEGPLITLTGDEAANFLTWFNKRATSSRNG